MIAAVELVADKASRRPFAAEDRRGMRVYMDGLKRGVVLRPLGNVVYFMPPYVVTESDIDRLVDAAIAGIEMAVAG